MQTKTKIIICIVALVVSFATGRFLSPTKVKTEVQTVTVEKIVERVVHTTTVITKKPDGSETTTIVSDSKTTSQSDTEKTDSKKEVTKSNSTTNISALIGMDTYGLSVSKNLLGPITFGGWATSNTSFGDLKAGVSIGINL